MKQNEQDLSLRTKVLFSVVTFMICAVVLFGAVGYTSYRNEAKADAAKAALVAAALQRQQLANVEALKTVLPLFRETAKGKEIADMAIVKVSQSALPATITAGLDSAYSPNPVCDTDLDPGSWEVRSYYDVGNSNPFYPEQERGWSVEEGGVVTIPLVGKFSATNEGSGDVGPTLGIYTAWFVSNTECEGGYKVYHYKFKVTPPCPTGVTLTAN